MITEEVEFDNRQRGDESLDSQSPSEPVATFTFDKEGRIESWFNWKPYFMTLVIILTATLSFGLGRLSTVGNRGGLRVEIDPEISNSQFPISNQASIINASKTIENSKLKIENSASVVASRSGTKYHYTYCPGAKQISEKNKLIFESAEAAEASGYSLAANCKPR